MENIRKLAEQIDSLKLEEARELVNILTNDFGYILPTITSANSITKEEIKVEEKNTFDVLITSINDKKLQIVKAYNKIVDGKLIESKAVIESPLPIKVKTGISKSEAELIKEELIIAGASVEIQ